jgi:hypothetical protein
VNTSEPLANRLAIDGLPKAFLFESVAGETTPAPPIWNFVIQSGGGSHSLGPFTTFPDQQ